MGQNISSSYTPPPISLHDCLIDGQIDLAKYRIYSKRTYDDDYIPTDDLKRKSNDDEHGPSKRTKYCRSVKRHPILLHNILLVITFLSDSLNIIPSFLPRRWIFRFFRTPKMFVRNKVRPIHRI